MTTPKLRIDQSRLEQVVSLMLGMDPIRIKEWQVRPIYGGLDKNNDLMRCQGLAGAGRKVVPWSLVVKKISRDANNEDPTGYQYWKREALVYQSGLLKRLPQSLAAPACYAVDQQADGSIWIWMEDVHDDFDGKWPMEFYGQVAQKLGLFNGAFLAGTPLPSEEWLAQDFLRSYVERAAPMIAWLHSHPRHPLVRSLYGKNLALILAVWEVRGDLLDILDKMPQVFCHQDASMHNLFHQQGKLVAIDWSFCGNASPGSELVPLVAIALAFEEIPAGKIHEFEQLCIISYWKGLTQAGAHIPTRSIRCCFILSLLLRFIYGANVGDLLPAMLDESRHTWIEKGFGRPLEDLSKGKKAETAYYMSVFIRALTSMGLLPLLKIIGHALLFSLPRRLKRD